MTGPREVRVWAWGDGVANFGDELGPAVLARLGYTVQRVPSVAEADVIACGSVLGHAALYARPDTIVWGSGLLRGHPVDVAHLDVRAVRGALSARAVGVTGVALADPGCLVPQLWDRPPVTHRLGVVRHYVDDRDYPWADLTIDASRPVDEVIAAIGSCARVASSSLHGLVVAAAWGIPTVRIHHPEVAGGDFKWLDWWSGQDADGLLRVLP